MLRHSIFRSEPLLHFSGGLPSASSNARALPFFVLAEQLLQGTAELSFQAPAREPRSAEVSVAACWHVDVGEGKSDDYIRDTTVHSARPRKNTTINGTFFNVLHCIDKSIGLHYIPFLLCSFCRLELWNALHLSRGMHCI